MVDQPKQPANPFQNTELEKLIKLFKKRTTVLPKMKEMKNRDIRDWFTQQMKSLGSPNMNKIMSENPERLLQGSTINPNNIGQLVMWFYDPKTKDKLPYYDRFPIGFIVGKAERGFHAINMHYLDPQNRMALFAALVDVAGRTLTTKQRLLLSYDILKAAARLKSFEPCFKRYLSGHVKSRFYVVPPDQWHIVLALPNTERFEKGGRGNKGRHGGHINKTMVWTDSRRKAGLR
jgi:Straboviridae terminal DNA protecting protein